jgi:hypothetical protein
LAFHVRQEMQHGSVVQGAIFEQKHREEAEIFDDDHYGSLDALEDLNLKYLTDAEEKPK